MSLDLFIANLLSPPILFFLLGIAATLARSDLEIPQPLPKLFSIYLLWAIGFKGGIALREAGLTVETLTPVIAAVILSATLAGTGFLIFRRAFNFEDTCALAATYASVSVVTFVTAAEFLESREIAYGGQMVAALALMEAPPIVVALMLRRMLNPHDDKGEPLTKILREALTSGPVFLLLGSLLIGLAVPTTGTEPLKVFTYDVFAGVLVLFLLDSGMTSGQRIGKVVRRGITPLVFAIGVPILHAGVGIALARLIGLREGDALLLTILAASASYIAVPATMQIAVPKARVALYLPMSLGITFPVNVCFGIPIYLMVIKAIWPEAAPE